MTPLPCSMSFPRSAGFRRLRRPTPPSMRITASRYSNGSIARSRPPPRTSRTAGSCPSCWRPCLSTGIHCVFRARGRPTSIGSRTCFSPARGWTEAARREAAPLPLPFQDAGLWIFRIPRSVDAASGESLAREAIEHYLENEWIHVERKGLGGRSPLLASVASEGGDLVARAKLTAVVKFREQLGSRPSTRALYKGYPFDRLRRRLGLERELDAAVDPLDLGCAAADELDQLDVASLDDSRLIEAASSAEGLGDDARTARFAGELVRRQSDVRTVDLKPLVSALVRQAISRGETDEALEEIERARSLADGDTAATFDVSRTEIIARQGRRRCSGTISESDQQRRSRRCAGARRRGHVARQRSLRTGRAALDAGPAPGTADRSYLARAPGTQLES